MQLSRTEDRGAGSLERGEGCLATCRLVSSCLVYQDGEEAMMILVDNNDYNEVNDDDQYSGGGGC